MTVLGQGAFSVGRQFTKQRRTGIAFLEGHSIGIKKPGRPGGSPQVPVHPGFAVLGEIGPVFVLRVGID
ncbi:MAG: hypothetical protein J4O09_05595, partial [Chloroflexi bacterium]|nr:hypothetical protein [Chloroflexota bacterium]